MKKVFAFFAAALCSINLFSQVVFVPRIHLYVDDADENSISITGMDVEAKITANTAITTYDIVFYNSSHRNLEGQFEFPLKEGQSVCGFALDINGKMRDGVIVEKEKGRQVFEEVVRTQSDPALLEVTAGNNFKARVYPVPKQGSRHIRIKIQENLTESKYILAPLTDKEIRRFSFKLFDFRNSVSDDKLSSDVIDLSTGVAATFERKNYLWEKPIEVKLAKQSSAPEVFIETTGADSYFYTTIPVEVKSQPKEKISMMGVYFDTSLSRINCNIEAELELLKAYVSKQGSGSVEIVSFSNEVNSQKVFKYSQWNAIEAYIKSFVYDGATNLNNIDYKTSKKYDEILIFTDGLNNWLTSETPKKFNCPVNTICSSASANYAVLNGMARNNNGIFINLTSVKTSKAISLLSNEALRLIKIESDSGIKEIYPAEGSIVDERFAVTGLLTHKAGSVKLQFGYGNKPAFEKSFTVDAVNGFEAENVGRLWAQKKIDELSFDYDKNKNKILEISREFTIVTEKTSLIVLESVRDYIRYKITPPEEFLDEYNRLTGVKDRRKEQNDSGIPQYVYENFKEFKKWWETSVEEFKQAAKRRREGDEDQRVTIDGSTVRAFSRAAAADDIEMLIDTNEVRMEAPSLSVAGADSVRAEVQEFADAAVVKEEENPNKPIAATVTIQAWNPKATYIKELKKVETSKMYDKYLELRADYASSPSFYMDVADYFYKENLKQEAIKILSNLSELNLENTDMLRAMGNKLMEFGCYEIAAKNFEHLIVLRPEVPQFLRDAALAYEKMEQYQRSCDLLYKVISRDWDPRYREIQQVCLNDMNSIISKNKIDVSNYDKELLTNFPVNIRIVLTWNTDDCDIDLWVTDPNGEKCYYAHNSTEIGGRLSRDFTHGYGPEEFCLKIAQKGNYKIQAHYYGAHQQQILQPVTVQAEVFTNFGTEEQKCELLTLQLKNVDGDYTIGEISY